MVERSEDGEGGFLSRWSRRKRAAEQELEPEIEEIESAALDAEAEAKLVEDEVDEEAETNRMAAEAIDIDSLQYEDDFKLFFKRGVPTALKNRALRQLWRSNPILANLDGLNDYDENFADPSQNVYKSLWQAGRGFLTEAEQKAQYTSGRLVDEQEAVEVGEDVALEEEVAASDDEAEPTDQQPTEASAQTDEEPIAVLEEDVTEEDEQEAAPVRVSLRRRLQG